MPASGDMMQEPREPEPTPGERDAILRHQARERLLSHAFDLMMYRCRLPCETEGRCDCERIRRACEVK